MDWSVYKDYLVRRSEILLDFTVLEGWNREEILKNSAMLLCTRSCFGGNMEYMHDVTRLEWLMEEPSRKVKIRGVVGDVAYDSRRNFNILEEKGMEPIMEVGGAPLNGLGDAHLGGKPWPSEERLRRVEAEVRLKMDS